MAEAEVSDDESGEFEELSEEDLARASREGLIDDSHFDLFVIWWQFGGSQRGLSPMEIVEMPAAMVKDFLYLMGQLNKKKKRLRKEKDKHND